MFSVECLYGVSILLAGKQEAFKIALLTLHQLQSAIETCVEISIGRRIENPPSSIENSWIKVCVERIKYKLQASGTSEQN